MLLLSRDWELSNGIWHPYVAQHRHVIHRWKALELIFSMLGGTQLRIRLLGQAKCLSFPVELYPQFPVANGRGNFYERWRWTLHALIGQWAWFSERWRTVIDVIDKWFSRTFCSRTLQLSRGRNLTDTMIIKTLRSEHGQNNFKKLPNLGCTKLHTEVISDPALYCTCGDDESIFCIFY